MKLEYPVPVRALILQLKRLPGIGPRSAERMALWVMQQEDVVLEDFARTFLLVQDRVQSCEDCGFFTTEDACAICEDEGRDSSILCVVEEPSDILPIDRTGIYQGQYHALGGRLSPLDNVGPDDLRIAELERRLEAGHFTEVILALGSDVAGEATSNYLAELLEPSKVSISRLAQGMPVGGGLDTADTLTLHRAFENRRGLHSS